MTEAEKYQKLLAFVKHLSWPKASDKRLQKLASLSLDSRFIFDKISAIDALKCREILKEIGEL